MGLLRKAAALALGGIALAVVCRGQMLVSWGAFGSGSYNLGSNWQSGLVPGATEVAYFGSTGGAVSVNASASVGGVQFAAFAGPYTISTASGSLLTIGQYGVVSYAPGNQQIATPISFFAANTPVISDGTGTLTLGNSGTNPTAITLGQGASLLFSGAGQGVVLGKLTGAGGVTFNGGTWTLWQRNDYSGATTITKGTVTLNTGASLPANGTLAILAAAGQSATLEVNVGVNGSIPNVASVGAVRMGGGDTLSQPVISISSGQLMLSGNLTYESANSPGSGLITSTSGAGSLVLSGAQTFFVQDSPFQSPDLSISARIYGGSLIKRGVGTLELSNAFNNYTGGTVVNQGVLSVTLAAALPTATPVAVESIGGVATLRLNGTSQTVSSLTLGGSTRGTGTFNTVDLGSIGMLMLSGSGNVTVYGSGDTLASRIGDGNGTSSGTLSFSSGGNIDVQRNNSLATGAIDLVVNAAVTGGAAVQKNGPGAMLLQGSGSLLTGALNINQGTVLFGSSFAPYPAAGGDVVVGSGAVIGAGTSVLGGSSSGESVLYKAVTLGSGAQLGSWDLDQGWRLNLAGQVTLQPTSTALPAVTLTLGGDEGTMVSGELRSLVAGTALTLSNARPLDRGLLAVTGAVDASVGSLVVNGAGLILSTVPTASALSVTNGGYIGVAPAGSGGAVPAVQSVVDRVGANKSTFAGTFGFDTSRGSSTPQTFADAVNFAGFGSGLTIGSLTGAIITGAITPPGSTYAFGNGGGVLVLRNGGLGNASGGAARALGVVSSTAFTDNSLKLVLQTANSFTGGITVNNSAVLLDAAGAFPASTSSLRLEAGSYLGFTENAGVNGPGGFRTILNPANFPTAFVMDPTAVIGLDSAQYIADSIANTNVDSQAVRYVADRVDLSLLGSVGLGSATRVTLLGSVVGSGGAASRSLRLSGVEQGTLEVRSRLTAVNTGSLTIGGLAALTADGTVILSGQNTYSGGTTLLSGTLLAASSQRMSGGAAVSGPLGLGAISVPAGAKRPSLEGAQPMGSTVLGNNFLLGSRLALGASTISSVSYPSQLVLTGTIGDSGGTGGLDIYSDVTLKGSNTFSGGINLYSGVLHVGGSSVASGNGFSGPLGSGPLTISSAQGGSFRGISTLGAQTLFNPVTFSLAEQSQVYRFGTGSLILTGAVTLNSSVDLQMNAEPLYLTGNVSGAGSLSASFGIGAVVLNPASGVNSFTGRVTTDSGRIVFGSSSALPAGSAGTPSLSANYAGYIGYASAAGAIQSDFLSRFDKGTTSGTIGLDSLVAGRLNVDPASGVTLFTQQLSLAGFEPTVRIGSASTAALSGSIIPAGNSYNFGGGGGWLEVSSALVERSAGATVLSVASSPLAPLTLRLSSGASTLTGGGVVESSALIFGNGAMPAVGSYTVKSGGYVGSEGVPFGAAGAMNSFLGRIAIGTSGVMVGVDAAPGGSALAVSDSVDLARMANLSGSQAPVVFLGTATQATFNGTIILPAGQSVYRFGAYKGGQLTIGTPLNSGSVQIGDAATLAFHGNPANPSAISTVTLTGNNSYSGGTTLGSGRLLLGNSSALGTGPLTVGYVSAGYASGLPYSPQLGASVGGVVVPNAMILSSSGLGLTGPNSFTLAGAISGAGGLDKAGTGTVTLSGANTFEGGLSVDQGTLIIASATGAGSGSVFLGSGGGTVRFLESSTIRGVVGDYSGARVEVAAGKTLTVNPIASSISSPYPAYDAVFGGSFAPAVSGNPINLVFSATVASGAESPQIRLSGQSAYAGTTTIGAGISVLAMESAAFGQSSVSVSGGRLALASGVTLANPFTLTHGSLAGEGGVSTSAAINVGSGAKLAPGFELPGVLTFSAASGFSGTVLSLLSGGAYRWKIGDATDTAGGWDFINVAGAVSVSATVAAPFTLQMAPTGPSGLLSGAIAGFDPALAYAWPILSGASISGFSPGSFVVDASAFANLAPDYKFSVGLDATANALVLNYNPAAVPEPSTWVMLLSGAAAGAVWLRRRRRI